MAGANRKTLWNMTSNPLSATAQAAIISGAPDSAYQLGITSSNAKHIEISRRYAWWARAWAPWMPQAEAREIADRVASEIAEDQGDSR
jgi:hypothetical protein